MNYGQKKEETLYRYDKNGTGSLVVQETSRSYGKKGDRETSYDPETREETEIRLPRQSMIRQEKS